MNLSITIIQHEYSKNLFISKRIILTENDDLPFQYTIKSEHATKKTKSIATQSIPLQEVRNNGYSHLIEILQRIDDVASKMQMVNCQIFQCNLNFYLTKIKNAFGILINC